jgi:uncharacterized membrane protein
MEFSIDSINWIGIIIATIAYSAFAGIWHRQFAFGKKWENAMGFKRPKDWKETNIYFIVPLVSCFIVSLGIAILSELANVSSYKDAVIIGAIAGVGFATTTTFTNAVIPTMKKPLVFGLITGTSHAISIILISVIIYAIGN